MTSVESVPHFLLGGVPIVHPAHLEGDATLATEILPGPPPLLSVQQPGARKDKKPTAPVSYLPVSDPGTTYGGLGIGAAATTVVSADIDGSRRKRARTNKGAPSARPQRASARVLNASSSTADMVPNGHEATIAWPPEQAPPDSSIPPSSVIDVDEPMLSRSNSAEELQSISTPVNGTNGKEKVPARKDKGKRKEREKATPAVRVKEEPVAITFSLNDYGPPLPNDDHCSSCQSLGSLVYCDGCPKAFHLWCLDPPMEPHDLPEGENRWFCPACIIQDNPPTKPSVGLKFMSPLIQQLQLTPPLEFRLPEEIRTTFKDVATGSKGAYVDTSKLKPPRLNRHGQLDDRDPHRLKDRSGDAILCFQCGTSALPSDVVEPPPAKRPRRASNKLANTSSWNSMISCDYCDLSWHLDCLDPPVSSMPPFGVKWMCPNHAEQVHKPKRRIPKQSASFIEITKPNQPNNGNVEVVHNELLTPQESRVLVDEVMINGRRYRVPERVVKLDFWNKVNGTQPIVSMPDSRASSPLTSLSSLDDMEDEPPAKNLFGLYSLEDVLAAQVLWNLQATVAQPTKVPVPTTNGMTNGVVVVDQDQHIPTHDQLSIRNGKRKVDELTIHDSDVPVASTSRPPSPAPKAANGRRRSARKPVPVKRVKIELSDDSTSESLSPPVISEPVKKDKQPKAKITATTVKKPRGRPSKASLSSDPVPKIPKTKTATSTAKAGKSAPSTVQVKMEPETSPKLPSLKIRLPRLSGLTSASTSVSAIAAPPTSSRTNTTGDAPKATKARRISKKHIESTS